MHHTEHPARSLVEAIPNVTVSYGESEELWHETIVSLTFRNRVYKLASLTLYHNGRALLMSNALMSTATAFKAYRKVAAVLGGLPSDRVDKMVVWDPEALQPKS